METLPLLILFLQKKNSNNNNNVNNKKNKKNVMSCNFWSNCSLFLISKLNVTYILYVWFLKKDMLNDNDNVLMTYLVYSLQQ